MCNYTCSAPLASLQGTCWMLFLDSLRCTVTQITASQSFLMWNVQPGASRLPPCSAPLRTWLTGAQLWSRTCVSRLHVFCARACASEPLAPERARCLSRNLMGRQQRRRCKDEPIWFYFCPCRDSAVLHSALLGFRTSDYLQEMQGNMLWTRDDWSCLSLRSFLCIVILRKQNSKEKKKGEEKQGVKYDPVLRDPCCVEQTGHCRIRPGTILHENIFSRKNNDPLLIAWKSITNVNNKQVLFYLAVLLIVPIHRCWVLRGLCVGCRDSRSANANDFSLLARTMRGSDVWLFLTVTDVWGP